MSVLVERSLIILVLVCITTGSFAQSADEAAIKAAALNYIEGWYSADTARISKALSKDLVKRGFMVNRNNQLVKTEATYKQMLEWTGKKPNELKQKPDMKFDVTIIEIGKNIAMAKVVSPQYIDYLHLGKMNEEWKIYNVIWELNVQKTNN